MNLLLIYFVTPLGKMAWLPFSIAMLSLLLIVLIAILRSGVHSITESEASILHNRKGKVEQRIYTFYQRKEKVKAALSTTETFLSLVFVLCISMLVRSGGNSFSNYCAIVDFGSPAWPYYIAFFVLLTFVLVIAIKVPGKMMSDSRRHAWLVKLGWVVDLICSISSPITFCNSYSNHKNESTNQKLTVAIGKSPAKTGEKEMIRNILQFGDIEVREIMTPRHDIVAVDSSDSFSILKNKIMESNFSRIPVFEDNTDNIFGIIYVKDLIKHLKESDDFKWIKLARRIKYVSENKKISDLLKEFQQNKNHMAAVCDEYGGISGLITMQDILEKIVGEISDEFDDEDEQMFRKISDNYYIFDGRTMLDEVCHVLGLEATYFDDLKGDAESLAGVMLEIRGEFPPQGEKIVCRDLTLSVEAFSGRRIEKIGVKF